MTNATFYYFKQSGKYYTSERGLMLTSENFISSERTTREDLIKCNNASMPGLSSNAKDFSITVIPDDHIGNEYVGYPIHCPL